MSKKIMGMLEWQSDEFNAKMPFYEGKNIIGRNKTLCNVFVDHLALSKKHAIMTCKDEKLTIRDCNSKNGVYINVYSQSIEPEEEIQLNPFKDILYVSDLQCKIIPNWSADEDTSPHPINAKSDKKEEEEKNTLNSNESVTCLKNEKEKQTSQENEQKGAKEKKKKNEKKKDVQKKKKKSQEKETRNAKSLEQNKLQKNKTKNGEHKRGESNETLAKKKTKKKTSKSVEKEEKKAEIKKSGQSRKKMPPSIEEHIYPRRNIMKKRVLLSNCKFSFVPSSKITIIDNYKADYDALVMEKYQRTFKLLFSICRGIPVISSSWVLQCESQRCLFGFHKFSLPGPEKQTIQNSVQKVRSGKRVFQGLRFCLISESYHLEVDKIADLIEEGGGSLASTVKKKDKDLKEITFIVPLEYKPDQVKQIHRLGEKNNIFTVQLILDACLRQSIDWDKHRVR